MRDPFSSITFPPALSHFLWFPKGMYSLLLWGFFSSFSCGLCSISLQADFSGIWDDLTVILCFMDKTSLESSYSVAILASWAHPVLSQHQISGGYPVLNYTFSSFFWSFSHFKGWSWVILVVLIFFHFSGEDPWGILELYALRRGVAAFIQIDDILKNLLLKLPRLGSLSISFIPVY